MDKTFFSVRDVSGFMGVSEKTVYRMLNENQLPFAVKIGGQWRFRRDAMENWLRGQVAVEQGTKPDWRLTVSGALQRGAVLFRVHGENRDEALDSLFEAIPHSTEMDWQGVKISVLSRESLASSCLGGIACMTTSVERPVLVAASMIILAFLERPVDFRALDASPCRAFFLTLAANTGEQAMLETRLRRLLMEKPFRQALLEEPGRKELQDLVTAWEEKVLGSGARQQAGSGR